MIVVGFRIQSLSLGEKLNKEIKKKPKTKFENFQFFLFKFSS